MNLINDCRSSSTPYGCSARLKINLSNRVMTAPSIKEKLMLLKEKQKREQKLLESGEQIGIGILNNFNLFAYFS